MKYQYKQTEKTADNYEFEVTMPFEELNTYIDEAFAKLANDVKLDGFRPGKGPKAAIQAKLGSKPIMEAITKAMPEIAVEIVTKEDSKPVNTLSYEVLKLDPSDGIVFKFSFVNFPEVKLGDFKKIKVTKPEIKIEKDEIDMVIKNIIRSSIKPERIKELTATKERKLNKKETKKTKIEKNDKENKKDTKSEDFELNDALIKELGYEKEKTVDAVRKSVQQKLKDLKQDQAEQEYLSNLLKEAIKVSKMDIPNYFVEREVKATETSFTERLNELKLDPETYFASQGTTLESKRKEWEKEATDKVSADILLITIANEHKVVASDEDIDRELAAIADPNIQKQYESANAREYVRTVITKQRGMEKLRGIVEGATKTSKKETK